MEINDNDKQFYVCNNEYFSFIYDYARGSGLKDENAMIEENNQNTIYNCDDNYFQQICLLGTLGATNSDNRTQSFGSLCFIRDNIGQIDENNLKTIKSIVKYRLKDKNSVLHQDKVLYDSWKILYKGINSETKFTNKVKKYLFKENKKRDKEQVKSLKLTFKPQKTTTKK